MINRTKMPRQLRNKGGITSVISRKKYGIGSDLKDFVRDIIPNELADVAVKAAPFVAPFYPGTAALMRGIGRFDQRGSISDALKQGAATYVGGRGVRALAGAEGAAGGFDTFSKKGFQERGLGRLFKGGEKKLADTANTAKTTEDARKGVGVIQTATDATIGKVPILNKLPDMVQQQLLVGGITSGASALYSYFTGEFEPQQPGETMGEYMARRNQRVKQQMRGYMDSYYTPLRNPQYAAMSDEEKNNFIDGIVGQQNDAMMATGGRVGYQTGGLGVSSGPNFNPLGVSSGPNFNPLGTSGSVSSALMDKFAAYYEPLFQNPRSLYGMYPDEYKPLGTNLDYYKNLELDQLREILDAQFLMGDKFDQRVGDKRLESDTFFRYSPEVAKLYNMNEYMPAGGQADAYYALNKQLEDLEGIVGTEKIKPYRAELNKRLQSYYDMYEPEYLRGDRDSDEFRAIYGPRPTSLGVSDNARSLGVSDDARSLGVSDDARSLGVSDDARSLGVSDDARSLGVSSGPNFNPLGVTPTRNTPTGITSVPTGISMNKSLRENVAANEAQRRRVSEMFESARSKIPGYGPAPLMPMQVPQSTPNPNPNPDAGLSGQQIAEKYGIPYAKGGRVKFDEGADKKIQMIKDMLKRGADDDTIMTITGATQEEIDQIKNSKAKGGMPTGIMRSNKAGVMERDYRDEGGFVPVGIKEKADDVPAMLSKNEFVFTADAVRGAGNGSIEKGAQRMYDTMKNLERRVV